MGGKIRALGYTAVSFYTDWALLEGQQGNFIAEGIFAFEPFFEAASTAGIYLLAVMKIAENDCYSRNIGQIISKAQITNGGPVILFQPENEYTQATSDVTFPDPAYFQAVEDQYRAAGIVVPFISNDASPKGYFAPGSGEGQVDIYGHDAYPLGFDCANPYTWPDGALPTTFRALHLQQSPSTPYSLVEFQGGSFDPGNLGHPGGYTSYDYGAVIAEDRTVAREKYSEMKLQANFLKVSLAYLTANPGNASNGSFVDSAAIATTQLKSNLTTFYVVRHAAYNSLNSTTYALTVPTSIGTLTIPQLGSVLTLNGRDSKIHVMDYDIDRNECYNYWVLDLPLQEPYNNYTTSNPRSIIVRAGYLLRTASVDDGSMSLTGDLNQTTDIEILGGLPASGSILRFNGRKVDTSTNDFDVLSGTLQFNPPSYTLPNLAALEWKYLDSLPEIQPDYDDSLWPDADLTETQNPRQLNTPTSLYGSDYGFSNGNLLFRGHFAPNGSESKFHVRTQGGAGYGASVFLNSTFLGSWAGNGTGFEYNQTLTLPALHIGQTAIVTVLLDNMGLNEDFTVGSDQMKNPRGILDYTLAGRDQSAVRWKVTGNFGGEDYRDRTRGPLNEGGLYAERQGYHLPAPPSKNWANANPTGGITTAGVAFYTTNFNLSLPSGYDIPLSFVFTNSTSNSTRDDSVSNYRSQLYVNGYQFGKYVNSIGPQTSFPVPEGILNYHGTNYIALSLWALDAVGAKVADLQLASTAEIQSGYGAVELSPMPAYTPRAGAY
ncbi:MAG: hypothetical protein Q9222_003359 [Ikaeria aurantiellina]